MLLKSVKVYCNQTVYFFCVMNEFVTIFCEMFAKTKVIVIIFMKLQKKSLENGTPVFFLFSSDQCK